MTAKQTTLRVAIIGGGLASVVMLRRLMRYPHIAAVMYEARPSLGEPGMNIELSPRDQNILLAIDPSIETCLSRAGAVATTSEFRIGAGPFSGQQIHVGSRFSSGRKNVGQQAFLMELLSDIPTRKVYFNTSVTSISEASPGKGVTLTFADGSQKKHDLIIGADGVRGITRTHLIGHEDLASSFRPSGLWCIPVDVSLDRARQTLGLETVDPRGPQQITWVGRGTMMRQCILSDGKDIHVTMAARHSTINEHFSKIKLLTPEEFGSLFSQSSLPAYKDMTKLVQSIYTIHVVGICQMQYLPTQTYSSKNACLISGAAHGAYSFPTSSVTLELEEALVLITLLGRASSLPSTQAALNAYDGICRPRADFVIRAAHDIDLLLTGSAPGVGLEASLLARALEQKWAVIEGLDINEHCMAALGVMEQYSLRRS